MFSGMGFLPFLSDDPAPRPGSAAEFHPTSSSNHRARRGVRGEESERTPAPFFFRPDYGPAVYSRRVLHENGNAMTSPREARDPRAFLPLKADFFHILLALSEEDLHGYGIMKAVEQNTGGEIRLEPSPLYRRLKRLLEDGIVDESGEGPFASSGDPRRRYYRHPTSTLAPRLKTLPNLDNCFSEHFAISHYQ